MRQSPRALFACAIIAEILRCSITVADVRLPPVFSDHMVLQRGAPLPVWGRADPGEAVTVTLGDQQEKAVADERGDWKVTFAPRVASKSPIAFHVEGKNSIRLRDVLVGEVWICAGQSNMEWPLPTTSSSLSPEFAEMFASNGHIRCSDAFGELRAIQPNSVQLWAINYNLLHRRGPAAKTVRQDMSRGLDAQLL